MSSSLSKSCNDGVVQCVYSAADLSFSGVVVPNGSASLPTVPIPFTSAYSFNLIGLSTAACSLGVKLLSVDRSTVLATLTLATAIAANTTFIYHGALELAPSITGTGTIGTALYLPVIYLQFFLSGAGAAGTGTMQLIQAVY